MAVSEAVKTISFVAGEAFVAADVGKLVEVSGANTVALVNAATDLPVGVLAEAPLEIGQAVPVALIAAGGRLKIQAGAAITAGQLLIAAADGQVTGVAGVGNLAADTTAVGIALMDGEDGEMIEMSAGYIAGPHSP